MASPVSETGQARKRSILGREGVRRLLLLLGSLGFAYFLIELPALLNILDYRAVLGTQFNWWPLNNTGDSELIHIRRPYVHFSGATRGGGITAGYEIPAADKTAYQWDVKYDHNGFRNETDLESAGIIVIGDSMVEGMTVRTPQLTTSLLSQLQGQVVANLGQSAYGPQQELIVLKRYGLPLRPHEVLWMFSESTDLKDTYYYDRDKNQPPDFLHAFWARSFTKFASYLLGHHSKTPGVHRAAFFQGADGKTVTVYFPYSFLPLTKRDLQMVDRTSELLGDAYRLCAEAGAHLTIVFVPDKFRVFHEFCRYPQESECRNWRMTDMAERLEKKVRTISPDIGYLDLTSKLVDGAGAGILPYFSDDEHWSPDGHRMAAEAIHDYLTSTAKP